ncbi:hypothetical protein CV093_10155 [Oceanobacillus sp. 143]|nr:hypothetical protein CV093_10155 [Oceanobacillus sp. 143]
MDKKTKRYIFIISFILFLLASFIPSPFRIIEEKASYYGVPANWLGLHESGGFEFLWIGFIVDVALFI